jgi:ADP-heptose:LPS heptosyltransferase
VKAVSGRFSVSRLGVRSRRSRAMHPARSLWQHLANAAFTLAGRVFSRARPLAAPRQDPRTILILQLQQIGDSVLFTPTLRALRARFPEARVDLLVNNVSWQFHKKTHYAARLVLAPSWRAGRGGTRLRPMLRVLARLRRERYDLVVADITQQAFKYTLLSFLIGARQSIGFDVRNRGFLHTLQVPFRVDANWVECNLDIARTLGATAISPREEVCFDEDDVSYVERLLAEEGISVDAPLVVIHTGSNWQSRTWYPERWAALADRLNAASGASVIFVGTTQEEPEVIETRRLMHTQSVALIGRTDIPQLAALFQRADLFVGTDSGPRHVAGAVQTPHVVLMSSQDDTDRWLGWRRGETVVRTLPACKGCSIAVCGHKTCMDLIRVGEVAALCEAVLARGGRNLGAPVDAVRGRASTGRPVPGRSTQH